MAEAAMTVLARKLEQYTTLMRDMEQFHTLAKLCLRGFLTSILVNEESLEPAIRLT